MSDCPGCGEKAAHVGILLPWKPGGKVEVLHRCANCDEEESHFFETAKDPAGVARKVRAVLERFEQDNGVVQTTLTTQGGAGAVA